MKNEFEKEEMEKNSIHYRVRFNPFLSMSGKTTDLRLSPLTSSTNEITKVIVTSAAIGAWFCRLKQLTRCEKMKEIDLAKIAKSMVFYF